MIYYTAISLYPVPSMYNPQSQVHSFNTDLTIFICPFIRSCVYKELGGYRAAPRFSCIMCLVPVSVLSYKNIFSL